MAQKIIKVGSSLGITVPKPLLEKLHLEAGDSVLVEEKDNKLIVSLASKEELSDEDKEVVKITKSFIERYRSDLEALA